MKIQPASLAWVRKNAARFVSTEVLRSSVGYVCLSSPPCGLAAGSCYQTDAAVGQMLLQDPSMGMLVQAHVAAGAQLIGEKCTRLAAWQPLTSVSSPGELEVTLAAPADTAEGTG